MVREWQPCCGNCAQYYSTGLSRFRILPRCYPDCIIRWLGECSPWLIVWGTEVGAKEFDHSLWQLHHALPPLWGRDNWIYTRAMNDYHHKTIYKQIRLLPKEQPPPRSGMFLAMMLACRSHCRCKMESHRVAPKATPLLTSWLNTWCTGLSSTSACSIHITCVKIEQELLTKISKEWEVKSTLNY